MLESDISELLPAAFFAVHTLCLVFFLAALIMAVFKYHGPAGWLFAGGVLWAAANLALIFLAARRPPVYGLFESVTTIGVVAGITYFRHRRVWQDPENLKNQSATLLTASAAMVFLCGLVFAGPVTLNHDFFMYANPWVKSFFFCRLVAAGIILTVGIFFAAALKNSGPPVSWKNFILRQNLLFMLGMLFFLISEFSGSVWSLKGWGDSWRWSGNFFQSTAIFFLFMLNFHLPPGFFSRIQGRRLLGTLSCFTIVFLFLY